MAIDTLLVFVGVYDEVARRRGDTGANAAGAVARNASASRAASLC